MYKIIKCGEMESVLKDDGSSCPCDERYPMYQEYLEWVAQGNVAEIEDRANQLSQVDKIFMSIDKQLLKNQLTGVSMPSELKKFLIALARQTMSEY